MYDKLHDEWCTMVERARSSSKNTSYGRAAKLVAVYVNVAVVLGGRAESRLAFHAHPPIDRILLQGLASSPEIESKWKDKWRGLAWTHLQAVEYKALIRQLREVVPTERPFWMLERYWQPSEIED
jgi:hypothetical protein